MKESKKNYPPAWAQRLLSWYCRKDILEDLQGDLNEYFDRNVKTKGPGHARFIYILDVIKFCRHYTIRKPEVLNLLIHWIMIGSYIKTSGRNLLRNKLFSFINIFGLAVSMSVGLLVIAFISDLYSYDDFQEKKNTIVRMTSTYNHLEEPPIKLATTSIKAGKKVQSSISGAEVSTLIRNTFGGDATVGDNTVPLGGLWADEFFFDVFSFPLLQGNAKTALKEPYSIVLTEGSAKKIFGATDVLGKAVKFDTSTYIITGVLKEIPKLSHMRFEALASFATADLLYSTNDKQWLAWESVWSNYLYIAIPENGNIETIQASLNKLSDSENSAIENTTISLNLQPLASIVPDGGLSNEIGPHANKIIIWVLIGLAVVIIASAGFNYTNLSIARSMRRSKEVGIRKVVGARKKNVAMQFITESVIIALLALALAFMLFLFLRSEFLGLDPFLDNLVSLKITYRLVLYFVLMALTVGTLSGLMPAIFFSKVNAIQVLRNAASVKIFRHVTMRKALIVVQYTFSLMFIATTIIGYNQYKSFLIYDLGFDTENVVNLKLRGRNAEPLIKELSEIPAISEISKSLMITSLGSKHGTNMKSADNRDSTMVWMNIVDEHYLPIHKHKLLAGTNFKYHAKDAEESEIIVNEQVLKRFDIGHQDPQKALGEVVTVEKKKLKIVGVLKDFHYGTMEDKIEPIMFRYSSDLPNGYLNLKVQSNDLPATMAEIEKIWKKFDSVHPFDAAFYNDQIEHAYSQFSVMARVIGFIGFLAVCISSLGLFGMVVFTTETRLKEISIRKVLGASEGKLIYLLSRGFALLLTVSALIALPITYIFFDQFVLTKFAYHQPISMGEILFSLFIVMVIALFMIGSQTLRVARSNPAEVLKNE